MTNKEPKAQTADLTAQCSSYKGNKRLQKGQQQGCQVTGCCPSPPLSWQPEASGPLGPVLNGGGVVPGPLDDRLGTILHLTCNASAYCSEKPCALYPLTQVRSDSGIAIKKEREGNKYKASSCSVPSGTHVCVFFYNPEVCPFQRLSALEKPGTGDLL